MTGYHITKVLLDKCENKYKKKTTKARHLQVTTFILNARLKPEAKKPPNGPIIELNKLNATECHTNGYILSDLPMPNCNLSVIKVC